MRPAVSAVWTDCPGMRAPEFTQSWRLWAGKESGAHVPIGKKQKISGDQKWGLGYREGRGEAGAWDTALMWSRG